MPSQATLLKTKAKAQKANSRAQNTGITYFKARILIICKLSEKRCIYPKIFVVVLLIKDLHGPKG
jgi:hypothetical protein